MYSTHIKHENINISKQLKTSMQATTLQNKSRAICSMGYNLIKIIN
uniref:Uncharacterized protein n=1 Tax=Anguilla anguilla TaxID=7936 RepID=A0A0E9WMR9_ANGAN